MNKWKKPLNFLGSKIREIKHHLFYDETERKIMST